MNGSLKTFLLLVAAIVISLLLFVWVRNVDAQPTTMPAVPVVPVPSMPGVPGVTADPGTQWTPTAVVSVITSIVMLLAIVLAPAVLALIKAWKAEAKADAAVATSTANTKTNERQQGVLDVMQQKLPPSMWLLVLTPMLALSLLSMSGGCKTSPFADILPGNDPFVVRTEQAAGAAFDVVSSIVQYDHRNLAFMKARLPAVHEVVQTLRREFPPLHTALRTALSEYKRTRTAESAEEVRGALILVQVKAAAAQDALTEITKAKAAANTAPTSAPVSLHRYLQGDTDAGIPAHTDDTSADCGRTSRRQRWGFIDHDRCDRSDRRSDRTLPQAA